MAMAGMSPAASRGVVVPDDLSVTGFDDVEISAHLQPSLTSVHTDVVAWGRAAATRLLELIDNDDATRPPTCRPHALLCAPPPVMHPTRYAPTEWSNDETQPSLTTSAAVLALGLTAACGGGADSSEARVLDRPDQGVALEQPRGDRLGQDHGEGVERRALRPEDHRAGDPGRQDLRGGHRRRDHRGQRPLPGVQHQPGRRPQFQKQGGLVALDDFDGGKGYVEERSGEPPTSTPSPDGKFYQIPWKQNPVMIFYNKDMFKKAGLDPENPPLKTYDEFLATSKKIVDSKAAAAAIQPSPSSEFFQSWFDFYPLYAAESGGKQTIEDGKATFNDTAGKDVWNFWAEMYENGYTPQEKYDGDSFADKKSAMAVVGPWAIAVYKGKVNWGVVPVPTKAGMDPSEMHTFTDAKNIGLYSACKNQKTAWDVLKFATSEDQDGKLLETTGQMPIRTDLATTYADYFKSHPDYKTFADQASRTVEVPNVPNSVEIWQEIRDNYSSSVIFAKTSVDESIKAAADKADELAGQPDAVRPRAHEGLRSPAPGDGVRGAVRALPGVGVRLPPRAGGLDQLPRLLLRGTGRAGRPAVRRARELPGGALRPRRAARLRQRRGLPGHQRAAHRGAVPGARDRAELGRPGTDLPAGLLLRALRDGERRAGRRVAVPVQLGRPGQPDPRSARAVAVVAGQQPAWRCR